jgi:hypothetical protein
VTAASAERGEGMSANERAHTLTGTWIDIQVAAVALSPGNCTVVSTDSDLYAVPVLSIETWAS